MKKAQFADTRPTKKYLVGGITKDVTIEACIFDLIDNSIDAFPKKKDQLISDYEDYSIELLINEKSFSIKDCGHGIDRELLIKDTLRFGSQTNHHNSSIGFFGIGLNRALFKLGKNIKIVTETINERSSININADEFLKNDNSWEIPITDENKDNNIGTTIEIRSLNDDIKNIFSDSEWFNSLKIKISQRYSEFLKKRLKIIINNKTIEPALIRTRDSSGFKKLRKEISYNGVSIIVEMGQNNNHFFTYERSYDQNNNATPQECGWFVYCNDRAIKLFDWTSDTGWHTKFHSEHNGFIGKAFFIGNASLLPWNTSKSDLDLNNEIYKKALRIMKDFSEAWRTHTFKVLKKGYRPITIEYPQIEDLFFDHEQPSNTSNSLQTTNNVNIDSSANDKNLSQGSAVIDRPQQQHNLEIQDQDSISDSHSLSPTEDNYAVNAEVQESEDSASYEVFYDIPPHALTHNKLFEGYPNGRHPFNIPSNAKKISSIVNEMSKLKLDAKNGCPYAALFLIRSFIELSCKYYINSKNSRMNLGEVSSLAEQVNRCLDHMINNDVFQVGKDEDSRNIDSIKALCNTLPSQKTIRNIQYLQNTLHNPRLLWDRESINSFWYSIIPFLVKCYE